jgi:hypothetical protein
MVTVLPLKKLQIGFWQVIDAVGSMMLSSSAIPIVRQARLASETI